MSEFELETVALVKRYGGVLANDRINLAVARGEIHAVMGENGAGKTTLMNMLYGLQRPDAGRILLHGREARLRSPLDAIAQGLGMVHQAFRLFPSLTAWENIVFGDEPRRGAFLNAKAARAQVAQLARKHGLQVDPDAVVGKLSVGARQRVEILKALYRRAQILILDEPTAVLTPRERDGLFDVVRRLAEEGRTILFVTHKLNEVMAITDRVTVLRDGRVAARLKTADTSAEEIVRAMTGRNVDPNIPRAALAPGAPLIAVEGLTIVSAGEKPIVDGVTFQVRGGEIVSIAGVAGNGQTELIEALTGLRRPEAGSVRIAGAPVEPGHVAAHRRAGLAYVPEDRALVGSALGGDAVDNLSMGFQRSPPLSRRGWLDLAAMVARARELIARFGVKIASARARAASLSGGNLQKLVVARELAHAAPALIAEQPTRGVDIGATEFIHKQLVAERDRGRAVLLVSSELSEILSLSDRVLVMYEGRILAEVARAEASEARLGLAMAGRAS